jgi:hypothetical protein
MKRFLIKILLFVILLLIPFGYYLCFLHPHFQKLADIGNYNLSSLGFILFDEGYTKRIIENYPEENYLLVSEYDEKVSQKEQDILTIGDSFSQPRTGSYSNYLAHITSLNVENLPIGNIWNPFKALCSLLNGNNNLPGVIIVESVERYFIERLVELDLNQKKDLNSLEKEIEFIREKKPSELQRLIERTSDYYRSIFTIEEKRPVRHLKLNKELFSCKGAEKDFYFYYEEITVTNTINEIEIASNKLDSLFMLAEKRGIKLIVLVAADAYDVYQSYIVRNPYPKKTVLDELSSRIENPCYIDTKYLFMPYLEQGVKDVYWCSDTHWSPVGAKIVAEEIARRLDSLDVLEK